MKDPWRGVMLGVRRMLGVAWWEWDGMDLLSAMCVTFRVVQRRLYRAGRWGWRVSIRGEDHGGEENVFVGKRRRGGYIVYVHGD